MSDRDETSAAAHVPVMLAQVLEALAPADGGVIVDGTFGAGGYTAAILQRARCTVVGIDRDPGAMALGAPLQAQFAERLVLIEGRFADMDVLVRRKGITEVDGVVLDLGVSSMQLDEAERGFSFMRDGPLDMRMDRGAGGTPSAAEIVNTAGEALLARILYVLGEERASRRIARAIAEARSKAPITRTGELAALVERTVGRKPGRDKIHPATRTFQALRIHVNRELEQLAAGLAAAERLLTPGGRLAVVSFHSLEDRIVKSFLAERSGRRPKPSRHMPAARDEGPAGSFAVAPGGARKPSKAEIAANPRCRSARLRVAVRTDAPSVPLDPRAVQPLLWVS